MLSPEGLCRPFDADGQGYVRAEGGVAFLLARSDAALPDWARSYARIVATGINSDGRTMGVALPSADQQSRLLDQIYRESGVEPNSLAFIEAHGTGTPAGDPAEASAIGRVLGRARTAPLPIGSVKSNIGHLEPASGAAGLLKAMLALEHDRLPASLHFQTPNRDIPFADLNLTVAAAPVALPKIGRPRFAGVSTFGFGGTNAHVIITDPDLGLGRGSRSPSSTRSNCTNAVVAGSGPIVLSAVSKEALRALANGHLESGSGADGPDPAALAAAIGHTRELLPERAAVLGGTPEDVAAGLVAIAKGLNSPLVQRGRAVATSAKTAFAFSGNGSQWAGMGRTALRSNAHFRASFHEIDGSFAAIGGWSLLEALTADDLGERLRRTAIAQPLLFGLQVATARALQAHGLVPEVVFGHSVGEVSAAHVAGALSLEQAVQIIHARSFHQESARGTGLMAAVVMGEAEVRALLRDGGFRSIEIAAVNAPGSVTVVGPRAAIEAFVQHASDRGIACKILDLDYPFHSSLIDRMREPLLADLMGLRPGPLELAMISTVTGRKIDGGELTGAYWWDNVRRPVLFGAAIEAALQEGCRAFVEIGPRPVLQRYLTDTARAAGIPVAVLGSLATSESACTDPIRRAAVEAIVRGARIDNIRAFGPPPSVAIRLPTYPWQRKQYRVSESPEALAILGEAREHRHPLLMWPSPGGEPVWWAHLDVTSIGDLADHRVDGQVVLPGAALAEMALAAGRWWLGGDRVELSDFDIVHPLMPAQDHLSEVRVRISPATGEVEIASRRRLSDELWQIHAAGRVAKIPTTETPVTAGRVQTDQDRSRRRRDGAHIYAVARRYGLDYGPTFRRLLSVSRSDDTMLEVSLAARSEMDSAVGAYGLHPSDLDAAFHGLFWLYDETGADKHNRAYLPIRFGNLRLYGPGRTASAAIIKIRRVSPRSIQADITLLDAAGETVASLADARFASAELMPRPSIEACAYHVGTEIVKDPRAHFGAAGADHAAMAVAIDSVLGTGATEASEPALLVQAAAQRIAYDAVKDIAGASRQIDLDRLRSERDLASPVLAQIAALLAILEPVGLAESAPAGWHIGADCPLPEADDLLRTVLEEHPSWAAECVLLNSARATLAERLSGVHQKADAKPYSSATLDQLRSSSPFHRAQLEVLVRLATNVVAEWPVARPLRILQVGAAPTGLARRLLGLLPGDDRGRLIVADTDKRAVDKARISLPQAYAVLIGGGDGHSQLAELGPFDLVVSASGLHGLSSVDEIIDRVRRSMAAGGKWIATEAGPDAFHDVVFGCIDGWFARSTDPEFPLSPLRTGEEWCAALETAGFRQVHTRTMLGDSAAVSLLVASAPSPDFPIARSNGAALAIEPPPVRKAHIVVAPEHHLRVQRVARHLSRRLSVAGFDIDCAVSAACPMHVNGTRFGANGAGKRANNHHEDQSRIGRRKANGGASPSDVIYLACACEQHADETPHELGSHLEALAALLKPGDGGHRRIWIFAPGGARALAGLGTASPTQTAVWSFARTAANEIANAEIRLIDVVEDLPEEVCAERLADLIAAPGPETEVILGNDFIRAVRVRRGLPSAGRSAIDLARDEPWADATASRLEIGRHGSLETFTWQRVARRCPDAGEVEIAVTATGLNFRDVMWGLGLLPEEALENGFAGPTLGFELSGRVTAIGAGVEGFAVGDPVIALAPSAFASHVTVNAAGVARLPARIDLEAAATIPVAFLTAYYSLHHLARLAERETVLIHGAAGGVGLAALQVARWRGAKVIATAGTEEKRRMLELLGADHVLSSRSLEFVDQVRALAPDGIDVVLNSLSGEAMERSLGLLRPFGRFLELGKRDFFANTRVGLRPFRRNVSYFGIDADQLLSQQPRLAGALIGELMELFESGEFTPLPVRRFEADAVVDAYRLMPQSGHIGKIVVTPARPELLPAPRDPNKFKVSQHGAHIVIGGLGGFGIAAAEWLANLGARKLVLISRSASPAAEAAAIIGDLRERGVDVRVERCDISVESDVEELLDRIRASGEIAGILHAAMVIDDELIAKLSPDRMRAVLAPKVDGAALLDRLTRVDRLDYFILFSSVTALIGSPGQAAYVAANGFLDGLSQRRRAEGLPALSVNWGAIADVGYLARNTKTSEMIARRAGVNGLRARHAFDLLATVLAADDGAVASGTVAIAPMNWSEAKGGLPILDRPLFSEIMRQTDVSTAEATATDLAHAIVGLDDAAARELVFNHLAAQLAKILHMPADEINRFRPLAELGMDSLMGLELRLAMQRQLGVDIPLVSLSEGWSVDSIAAKIVARLRTDTKASHLEGVTADLVQQHVSDLLPKDALELVRGEVEMGEARLSRVLS
jgi:phthiocerol/phenolphthiocerol synthesis type-I polyketide synthase C